MAMLRGVGGALTLIGSANPNFSRFVLAKSQQLSTYNRSRRRCFSSSASLDPPDVSRLAETARISLSPPEVDEFGPKIQQVVEWLGQLQAVDLESIEPSLRADIERDNFREDQPETFQNREAIIAAIPSYEEPYIKVPKVLNKE